jgi:hypothetical protein
VLLREDAIAALAGLDTPLPNEPNDPGKTLEVLDRIVSPATLAMAGPRFSDLSLAAPCRSRSA